MNKIVRRTTYSLLSNPPPIGQVTSIEEPLSEEVAHY